MSNNESIRCPICKSESQEIKNLDSKYIISKLSEHFGNTITADVEIENYKIMRCNECSFEFANPLVEGSNSFYDWITSQQSYYPAFRWEYSKVLDLISKEKIRIKLLDVGCGDGQFLDQIALQKNGNIDFFGIDPAMGSVQTCENKGYKVFCMDVEKYKSNYKGSLFDVIVSFHCLEHIGNPKEFVGELVSLLNPTGAIYISTPYSPMDFELDWYDVLNHPPHHMGRWNLKSYNKLAEILGLEIEFFVPEPAKLLNTAVKSFMFSVIGHPNYGSKGIVLKSMILFPTKFITHLYKQSKRVKMNGKRAPNVILIKFTKK